MRPYREIGMTRAVVAGLPAALFAGSVALGVGNPARAQVVPRISVPIPRVNVPTPHITVAKPTISVPKPTISMAKPTITVAKPIIGATKPATPLTGPSPTPQTAALSTIKAKTGLSLAPATNTVDTGSKGSVALNPTSVVAKPVATNTRKSYNFGGIDVPDPGPGVCVMYCGGPPAPNPPPPPSFTPPVISGSSPTASGFQSPSFSGYGTRENLLSWRYNPPPQLTLKTAAIGPMDSEMIRRQAAYEARVWQDLEIANKLRAGCNANRGSCTDNQRILYRTFQYDAWQEAGSLLPASKMFDKSFAQKFAQEHLLGVWLWPKGGGAVYRFGKAQDWWHGSTPPGGGEQQTPYVKNWIRSQYNNQNKN